jgi:CMP-N-acetylneuraminic acid synthetase
MESDAFWLASREMFAIHHRRVGFRPYFCEVSGIEALDVDTEDDWRLCEIAAQGGAL